MAVNSCQVHTKNTNLLLICRNVRVDGFKIMLLYNTSYYIFNTLPTEKRCKCHFFQNTNFRIDTLPSFCRIKCQKGDYHRKIAAARYTKNDFYFWKHNFDAYLFYCYTVRFCNLQQISIYSSTKFKVKLQCRILKKTAALTVISC